MSLHNASFEGHILSVVTWKQIMNCLHDFVYVLGCVGTETNINVSYRQLRQVTFTFSFRNCIGAYLI